MEKRKPSYDLAAVQAVLGTTLATTTTAAIDAAALGYDGAGIMEVIRSITPAMFYKSMTTFADHRLWQDVYYVPTEDGLLLYVKFQADVVTEFKLVSFKEK
ncbi:MAG TPA: type II toxin-antitoxin system MqsR family toxin [Caulobacteraceae bacterium]|nr:type II toxin-antitoxin system MqsR family toxin [Caulobacteraceae bacterium]